MNMEKDYIKLIFGLKLKQARTNKNLSLFGLAKITELSKSYLNEIEKGKKYPKTDKIILLAEKLEITYDHMVSLKLDNNLAPIGEILKSGILKEIPLDIFGIQENDLIDIIANAPAKVNAFISTIIEIAQHYNLSRESFFLAALRSYQEAHNNYFEDLEQKVLDFSKAFHIDMNNKISLDELAAVLREEYGYTIQELVFSEQEELGDLRSIYVPKSKTLLLSLEIDEQQKAFILAKEIAYNYLKIEDRLYTFSWIKFDNFDQVLNNFYASYFAGALLIPRKKLIGELNVFLSKSNPTGDEMIELMNQFNVSPESFYQRLTNILPKDFQLKNLFFLRLSHKKGTDTYQIKKELHITNQQEPHANEMNEHYCRRWISVKTIEAAIAEKKEHYFGAQISRYDNSSNEYLVFSSATADPFKKDRLRSISVGILISTPMKKKFKFINNEDMKRQVVGVTCETCAVKDCEERASPPIQLEQKKRHENTDLIVQQYMAKFS
ncbi:helix-turn-helix domain-containing protein [Flavobacterium muglaense]|uniref:Helix-turn-helix domain-containing protein n=1 Tax=Flavobacterium muglaense TaxID=2764716 RepID=A0A923SGT3_9FLAO|nr:XRE family transcriptional regulator [Flavobacterium muglaense]MBC5839516.1 helix-turn-helix domain-containing protein [Flavobacterium muglaense]MBC5846041.1 helix-turn-helix domain-containing protein [Flavobacterium muglaense]